MKKWLSFLASFWDYAAHLVGAIMIICVGMQFVADQAGNFDPPIRLLMLVSTLYLSVRFMWEPAKKHFVKRREVMES